MLIIIDISTIQYIIQETIDSVIKEIVFITNSNKHIMMENHFDKNSKLKAYLSGLGKMEQMKRFSYCKYSEYLLYLIEKNLKDLNISYHVLNYLLEMNYLWIILGDDIIVNDSNKSALKQLIDAYMAKEISVVGV